ncbi:hypothetical protein Hanom_Chr06g00540911 [Helianthus anomalus]
MLICDFYERYIDFFNFFNNVLRLTPRPASRLTPREAKGKRLDTRFRLFKPWMKDTDFIQRLVHVHLCSLPKLNERTRTRSFS